MKYLGSIFIVDEEGNKIYERALTPDEMIDALISTNRPQVEEAGPRPPTSERRPYKKHNAAPKEKSGRKVGDPKECCKSTGARHFKWCSTQGGTGTPRITANGSGRIPFSEATYNSVRAMFDSGHGIDFIIAEKGFDAAECQMIRDSKNYNHYFRMKP